MTDWLIRPTPGVLSFGNDRNTAVRHNPGIAIFEPLSQKQAQFLSQFTPSNLTPAAVQRQMEQEAADMEQAFALPEFASNRICTWCAKFCSEDHIASCEKRLVVCPICRHYILASDGVSHYQTCQEQVLQIATSRVVSILAARQREAAEAEERRRVEMFNQKAEADAAALRQRAASLSSQPPPPSTKKQSLSNLLFSGVSVGDTTVKARNSIDQPPVKTRSVVRILSQPEVLRSPSPSTSSAAGAASARGTSSPPEGAQPVLDSGSESGGSILYNRSGSFFSKTNIPASVPNASAVPAPSDNGTGTENVTLSSVSLPANFQNVPAATPRGRAASASLPSAPQVPARRQTVAGPLSSEPSDKRMPPSVLPASRRGSLPVTSSVAPLAQQTATVTTVTAAEGSPVHRQSVSSAGSPVLAPRAPSVESIVRPASTTSAVGPDGNKRCKWCGQQAPVDHEKKCALRIVMCKKCSSMIKMKDKEEHVKICSALHSTGGGSA